MKLRIELEIKKKAAQKESWGVGDCPMRLKEEMLSHIPNLVSL